MIIFEFFDAFLYLVISVVGIFYWLFQFSHFFFLLQNLFGPFKNNFYPFIKILTLFMYYFKNFTQLSICVSCSSLKAIILIIFQVMYRSPIFCVWSVVGILFCSLGGCNVSLILSVLCSLTLFTAHLKKMSSWTGFGRERPSAISLAR